MEEAIRKYFRAGLQNSEILLYLEKEHNIKISLSTLKRTLQKLGLHRRKNFSSLRDVAAFIDNELNNANKLHGYKWWHKKLIMEGFAVKREAVRLLLKLLDPEGVETRSRRRLQRRSYYSKGPNFLWHTDGYDKLKPFGIAIHAGIDGYSRYVLWLRAGYSNNDPKIVCGYFLEVLRQLGGFPVTIRSDRGNENGKIEILQKALREKYSDSSRPGYFYGTSTLNQRIESWWGILRKHLVQFYLNLFHKIKDEGYFNGSQLDKALIRFCFTSLIQKELDQLRVHWNTHIIRKTNNAVLPAGKPCNLFFMPHLTGGENQLILITDEQDYEVAARRLCKFPIYPCDETVYDACRQIMIEKHLERPQDPFSALNLYTTLRENFAEIA